MKWITKEEVREYATTPARALDISIRHHQQIVDATEKQLSRQREEGVLGETLCGLCAFYFRKQGCSACLLGQTGEKCCDENSFYDIASDLYCAKPFDHKAFIKAETVLLNRLKQLQIGDKSMDNKEKKQVQIEQIEKAEALLVKEREQLQSELSALAKPELRHGDYGFDFNGSRCMVIVDNKHQLCDVGIRLHPPSEYGSSLYHVKTKLGNIFDDLAALAEPLESFEVVARSVMSGFVAKIIIDEGEIVIDMGGSHDTWIFNIDKATEIHRKLGRLIATAKRKAAKT